MGIHISKKSKRKVNVDEKEHLDRQDSIFNQRTLKHTEYPRSSLHRTGSEYTESGGNFSRNGITLKLQNKEKDEISCCDFAVSTDEHVFEEFIYISENRTNFDMTISSEGKHNAYKERHIRGNKTNYFTEEGSRYGLKSVNLMQRRKHDGRSVQQTVHSCAGQQCILIPGTVTESQDNNYNQAIRASKSEPKFRPWTTKGERLIFQSNIATEKDIMYECLEKKQNKYSSTDVNFVFLTNDGIKLECASSLVPATDILRLEQSNEPRKVKNISYGHCKNLESNDKEISHLGERKKHRNMRSSFTPVGYKINVKVNPVSGIMDVCLPGQVLDNLEQNQ
ncbi:hypothetical protein CHS0354_040297 [Potamilus streckersoni]|uniref:Uncharacterized protein n=1 Tax=Potamilus streckersoni TaxID=2493646 RepID=A0AAE0SH78_9BIVA|nr:hypothetical protein CHS0354_040297 [Potamilus streckersoni]